MTNNKRTPIVEAQEAACPHCGSTRRERYRAIKTMNYSGTDKNGKPYTHIIWRRTACKDCRRKRIERSTANWPA